MSAAGGGIDVADQLERIVKTLDAHPMASIVALIAILLILAFQKDGLLSKLLGYLEARANREAALEERRMDIISMLENRSQRQLPGIIDEEVRSHDRP